MAKQTASRYDLILFDVDGVIIDSFERLYQTISSYIKEHKNEDFSRDDFRAAFEGNALETIMKRAGFDPQYNRETSWSHVSQMLFHSYQESPVFLGMQDVLAALSKTTPLVVVTSSPVEMVQLRFDKAGLSQYFAAYLGPEASVYKDEKAKMALEEFGVQAERTCFVTDTLGDLREVQKTPVHTVAVTWGYHDAQTLLKTRLDALVETPDALLQALT